jgi:hypothetical protein
MIFLARQRPACPSIKDDVDLLSAKPSPTTSGQPGYYGGNSKDPTMEMPMISNALPTR